MLGNREPIKIPFLPIYIKPQPMLENYRFPSDKSGLPTVQTVDVSTLLSLEMMYSPSFKRADGKI